MYRSIDTKSLKKLLDKLSLNLIDIRPPYDYKIGHIKGSVNIPVEKLINSDEDHLTKDQTYYIICNHGLQSSIMCEYLDSLGYQVVDVLGGIADWNYELVK